ncbi:MAG: YgiW/YdeI family stress tolerance OB fold protein [Yokenella regensburgei]|jgi:uncharacterized protein (TIGR00156 family)|nr:YgiW/YdeI family stress tolerance OB fold protein [Yokenella regensburgei]
MKKITTLLALTTAMITTSALAQDGGFSGPGAQSTTTQGGFVAPVSSVTTATNARTLADDTWVTLKGNIEQRTGDEAYLFRDKSGSIRLDIDDKRWNGLTLSPQDTVEIQGKVDKDLNDVKIDVKQITKTN